MKKFDRYSPEQITALFVLYGFFTAFKPHSSFNTDYLVDVKKFTNIQISNDIIPIQTYTYLVFLIQATFIAAYNFKIFIILEAIASFISLFLVLFCPESNMAIIAIAQTIYGLSSASSIAYYSYIYKLFPPDEYQRQTGYTRAAVLIGRCSSSLLSQLLYSCLENEMDKVKRMEILIYLSIASTFLAIVIGFIFPTQSQNGINIPHFRSIHKDLSIGKAKIIAYFKSADLMIWSFLWIIIWIDLSMAGSHAVNLWREIAPKRIYLNGAIDATARILAAAGSLLPSLIVPRIKPKLHLFVGGSAIAASGLLIAEASVREIFISYGCYILFFTIAHLLNSTLTAQIAQVSSQMNTDTENSSSNFAFNFGLNMVLSLSLASAVNAIIKALSLMPSYRFYITGALMGLSGVLFVILYRVFVKSSNLSRD